MSHFSLAAFKFFYLSAHLLRCVLVWLSLYLSYGVIELLEINVFHQVWGVFSHCFFGYFFLSFLSFRYPAKHMLVYLMVTHISQTLSSFFSFLLFRLRNSCHSVSSLILSSDSSHLRLSPCSNFSFWFVYFSYSRIIIWCFLKKFYLYSYSLHDEHCTISSFIFKAWFCSVL